MGQSPQSARECRRTAESAGGSRDFEAAIQKMEKTLWNRGVPPWSLASSGECSDASRKMTRVWRRRLAMLEVMKSQDGDITEPTREEEDD